MAAQDPRQPAGIPQAQPLPQSIPQPVPLRAVPLAAQPAVPLAPKPAVPLAAQPAVAGAAKPAVNGEHSASNGLAFGPSKSGVAPIQPSPVPTPAPVAPRPLPTACGARPIPVERRIGALPVARDDDEEDLDPEQKLKRLAIKDAPPWMISAVAHMILVLILGLWTLIPKTEPDVIELDAVYAEKLGEQLLDEPYELANSDQQENFDEQIITPENLKEVDDPFAAPPQLVIDSLDGTPSESSIIAPTIGLAFDGRTEGRKQQLLKAFGGNAITEQAVQDGLAWLARQQNKKEGSWSMLGPYSDAGVTEYPAAATAMALLAFQGAGNTHKKGQYHKEVEKGLKFLLKEQDREGNFFHVGARGGQLYSQAQCTIVVCELYAMSKDSGLRDQAQLAVQYCLKAQSPEGGWRYDPGSESDTSVSGWMMMALQSARMAKLAVPKENLDRLSGFLDKVASDGGHQYSYQIGEEPRMSMTAEGLLCRQYLGWARKDERLVGGADLLMRSLPRLDDQDATYYWYYATQVMHHMEGEHWKAWNEAIKPLLVDNQVKTGAEKGSWDPDLFANDRFKNIGGRLYVTCLSIFMLEVYYRHLPLYSSLRGIHGDAD